MIPHRRSTGPMSSAAQIALSYVRAHAAELGLLAANGGELLVEAPALLSEEKWQRLVSEFLRG